jgi:hypothetical protein
MELHLSPLARRFLSHPVEEKTARRETNSVRPAYFQRPGTILIPPG